MQQLLNNNKCGMSDNYFGQDETNKYCNYLSPDLNNDQCITVYHHIHTRMLHYAETLPHSTWCLVWKTLIKFSFPTLDRLGFPTILAGGANKWLDLLGFSMEGHPLYTDAYEYPPEKSEIDGGLPEPAGGGEPAAKRARKSPAPKKCEKKFLDQLNATEIMVLKVWDGTEWRFIHIIEDFHKATASVLLLVPDGERKVLSLECVWKAFLLYVFQKGTEWRGNFVKCYIPFRKAIKARPETHRMHILLDITASD